MSDFRRNLLRYGLAFVIVTAICFGVTLISAGDTNWELYGAGWALALISIAIGWWRPSLWLIAPFGALGGAIIVRASTDGLDAGIGPLLLIPILAVAVYGSRRALVLMVACVTIAVLAAQILVAEDEVTLNPVWRQDLVLVVLAAVLGVVIQDLVSRMRKERNLAEERGRIIEEMALTDPLTGIDNRRGWERAIQRSVGQARRHDQPLCLAMLDLDHFKQYNDQLGHQAGDDYLRRIAQNWEEMTRVEDHIARYGGEEFVLTLPDTDIESARRIVERLRSSLPAAEEPGEQEVSCSAGIAQWDGKETVRELVTRADQALYSAKEDGRDRTAVEIADPPHPATG